MPPKLDPATPVIIKPTSEGYFSGKATFDQKALECELKKFQSPQSKEHKEAFFTYYAATKRYFYGCNPSNQIQIIRLADFSNPRHRTLLIELAWLSEELTRLIVDNLSFGPKTIGAFPALGPGESTLLAGENKRTSEPAETKESKSTESTAATTSTGESKETKEEKKETKESASSTSSSSTATPRTTRPLTIYEQYNTAIIARIKNLTESKLAIAGSGPLGITPFPSSGSASPPFVLPLTPAKAETSPVPSAISTTSTPELKI